MTVACRLCHTGEARLFQSVGGRDYWRCPVCSITFLDATQLPDRETERERYALHVNDLQDKGYRRFLSKLAQPMLAKLAPAREGLDYGCGSGPLLASMLVEAGHAVRLYDPLFHPDAAALERSYDFITCTEVAEHFHHPAEEFARLRGLLRPGGWLGVMTCFQAEDARFADWHYRRDIVHVAFYRAETFHWLAARFGWSCEIPVKDVVLMRRPDEDPGRPDGSHQRGHH